MYTAAISRASPTCLLFLIDQSTSMGMRLDDNQTKGSFLVDVVNKTLYSLVINCTKADGIRDYFWVGVIGYSGNSASNVLPAVSGRDDVLYPISVLASNPVRVEDRVRRLQAKGDIVEQRVRFPVWINAVTK